MRTLYLLRHAKSSWDDPALSDHERPLAPRGRRDGKRIAEHLRRAGIEPELVLCSSAARTRETLELVGRGWEATVAVEDELYGATAEAMLQRLRLVPDPVESVMVIGHNPGMQALALVLAEAGEQLEVIAEKFPTGALATLELAGRWRELEPEGARLAAYVVPKQLP